MYSLNQLIFIAKKANQEMVVLTMEEAEITLKKIHDLDLKIVELMKTAP